MNDWYEIPARLFDGSLGGPAAIALFKGSLLLLAGFAVSAVLSRSSAGSRHLAWSVTLVGLLLLPLLSATLPAIELRWIPAASVNGSAADGAGTETLAANPPAPSTAAAKSESTPRTAPTTDAPTSGPAWSWSGALWLLYLGGMLALLARLAWEAVYLAQLRRHSTPLSGRPDWSRQLEEAGATSARRRVAVATSPDVTVPMTWGWRRPVILLPAEAQTWSAAERRQALLHEMSHIQRRDWPLQMLVQMTCIVYWFHPLVWLAARRLFLEAERACDDRVLSAGARSSDYAAQLVGLARRVGAPGRGSVGAVTMARRSQLSTRIQSILNDATRRSPMTRNRTLAICSTGLSVLLLLASATFSPAAQAGDTQQLAKRPPLMSALLRGDVDAAERAILAGADVEEADPRRGTALIVAASRGEYAMVDLLLAHGADPNRAYDSERGTRLLSTPLANAARGGHLAVAERLLDAGARVDAAPYNDATALMEAAEHGHLPLVDLLIERGADPNAVLSGDGTALIKAAHGGHGHVVERLIEEGADPDTAVDGDGNPLIAAAGSDDLESVQRLLDAGADPDSWVDGDESPLYHATRSGNIEAVEALLDAGADVNAEWPGDGTALIVAAKNGHEEIAEMLVQRGARADQGVSGDGNALIMAAGRGSYDMVRAFIDSGADVNAGVRGDGNALIMAASGGHLDVVRLLLENGAAIDKVVPGDENALIRASEGGHLDVVEYLVEMGADVNMRVRTDGEIRTPLNQALRRGHEDVADFLRSHGARD